MTLPLSYSNHNQWESHSILEIYKLVVLCSGCFGQWMAFLTRYQIDPRTWTDCKLYQFLFYFGRHYSSMLLVLMSIEKCFAVYFPLKAKTVCTVKTAKWASGTVEVILAGYALVSFFAVESGISKSHGRHACIFSDDYSVFLGPVDVVLYSFGPFTIMLITNFAIVFKFMRAKCNQNNSSESTEQALAKSATRGTSMVVTVSVTFLLLTTPTAMNTVLWSRIRLSLDYTLYRAFMNLTQYLNHSINGILYIIVGSRFRKELLNIFGRKEKSEGLSFSHSVKTTSLSSSSSGSRNYVRWNIFT